MAIVLAIPPPIEAQMLLLSTNKAKVEMMDIVEIFSDLYVITVTFLFTFSLQV
jgi:hypothetical protein